MIKKLVVMVALLPLMWPSAGGAADLTGLKLLEYCERDLVNFCHGYVLGVADTITIDASYGLDHQVCFPEDADISAEQLRLVYIDWAKRNPAKLHYKAFDAAEASLVAGFPCE